MNTVPAQIERRRSNKQKWFFGAVEFKFEPNMTVLIKNLAQKVDFWANCRSNRDCRSICAGTVDRRPAKHWKSTMAFFHPRQSQQLKTKVASMP